MLSKQGVLVPCFSPGVPGRDASLVVLSLGARCRWQRCRWSSAVAVPLVAVEMRDELPRAAWRQVGHIMQGLWRQVGLRSIRVKGQNVLL